METFNPNDELKIKLEHIFLNDEESLSKLIKFYIQKCQGVVTYDGLVLYFVYTIPPKCSINRLDKNLKSMVKHKILNKKVMYKRIIIYKINEDEE